MSPLCRVRMARGCAVRQDNFDDYARHSSAVSLRMWLGIAGPEGRVWTLGLYAVVAPWSGRIGRLLCPAWLGPLLLCVLSE